MKKVRFWEPRMRVSPMKETSQKTLARAERKRDRKDGIEGGQHTEERKKSKREKVDGRDTEKQ